MNDLKITAVKKAVQILENMNCKFYVVMEDGTTFGKNRVVRKNKSGLPHGALAEYFKPLIKNAKPGEIIKIPLLNYNRKSLASSLTAHLTQNWGHDSYVYQTVGDEFHLLRLA